VRGWPPLRGVLVAKNKYIDVPIPELYDLVKDPKETDNLAPREADRVQVLVNTLHGYNMSPPGRPGLVTPAEAASLKALGYASGSAAPKATYTEADDPKNLARVDLNVHEATDLYQSGKVQEAINLLENVVAEHPDTSDAVIQLAYAYYESGQVRPAIATLERAMAKGSTGRDIRIRLGLYLSETGIDTARAITLLEGLPTDDVEALNGLGVAYGDAGRNADAIRVFRRVLELDPTNGLAYQNLASSTLRIAQDTKNPAKLVEAEGLAKQAIAADPSLASAYTTYGVILSGLGRKAEAIDSFKHAVDLDNTEFDSLYNLWMLLKDAGRRDEAVKYGRLYVQTAPPALDQRAINEIRAYLGGG
jgi:tetratricopeptide (TPR) repeat protein